MLHGSPGSHADFREMLPELASAFHVLAPDLPGFGEGAQKAADYGFLADARVLAEVLEREGGAPWHVVGFSMGSAVALELSALAPERVASVTMLAGLGVEELELLGDSQLNHSLHALLLGLTRAVDLLVPHFGAFDRFPINVAHARNFYDSKQARLRPLLEQLRVPVLILHGDRDVLVSPFAAREHARIVPQAELVWFEGANHFLPWTHPAEVSRAIGGFVRAVEASRAPRREDASDARRAAAALPFDPASVPPASGFALVIVLVLLAAATLVSEDLTCIAAGWLVSQGRVPFLAAATGCFAGIFLGDLLLYAIGRLAGRPALARRPLSRWVSPEALDQATAWFERRGLAVIFLSRFTPGLRLPTYLLAGALRTRFFAFAGLFAVAAAVWTPLLVALSAWLGESLFPRGGDLSTALLRALPWLLLLVLLVHYVAIPGLTHAGRRKLRARWMRLMHFEFWPSWALYGPIVPGLLWQAWRHRSATLYTAANPGMPDGGFVGSRRATSSRRLAGMRAWVASGGCGRKMAKPNCRRSKPGWRARVSTSPLSSSPMRGNAARTCASCDRAGTWSGTWPRRTARRCSRNTWRARSSACSTPGTPTAARRAFCRSRANTCRRSPGTANAPSNDWCSMMRVRWPCGARTARAWGRVGTRCRRRAKSCDSWRSARTRAVRSSSTGPRATRPNCSRRSTT
ncbi:MAG: alpha/beta fold hydrolase [Planctomycetota bacterium]